MNDATRDDLWQALHEAVTVTSRETLDIYFFAEQEWLTLSPETQAEYYGDPCVWIEEPEAVKATMFRAMRYLTENL
jgi:hypothetical protein